ncbi:V-type ATPase subunit [Candidatus Saganbacteria bacterium]|nr:V-type ATPase subunit [Candidatus Saganbacteria bacterium]
MVEFAYAVGRIRALEAHLLGESQVLRLAESRDFESAYLVLRENPAYAEKLDRLEQPFDFERLLEIDRDAALALLKNLAPDHPLLTVLYRKYEPDLKLTSYLELLKQALADHPVPLFKKYARGFILLNELRLKLISGGFEPEAIESAYRYTDYRLAVSRGMAGYQKTGSLFILEREIDNYLMETLKRAKYTAFGIEPLVGFFYAKEIEHKLVRLILTLKKMKVPPEALKERLRLSYV